MSVASVDQESQVKFEDLKLSVPILEAIQSAGYHTATPIQAAAIPVLLAGRDLLGQAQTGTGKTAAFALPMLARIDVLRAVPQVLVLTPTRELAIQVAEAFKRYGAVLAGLRVAAIYGGQDYHTQFRQLDRGAHVIVGTPGRVMDHMKRGSLKLDGMQGLVLDEADEMLQMGFAEDVDWVLNRAPEERQIALFSATIPEPIRRIARRHLRNPATITIKQRAATPEALRQRYVVVSPHQKREVLARVLEAESIDGVLVFVNTKGSTEPLADYLSGLGHRTAALSGDVPQSSRERIVESLRSGKLDVIIATDVAARGLDVQRLSHVINYDLPLDTESYIHRIGRTGRASREGNAILFLHAGGRHMLRRIEDATRQTDRADGNPDEGRDQRAAGRPFSRAYQSEHGAPGPRDICFDGGAISRSKRRSAGENRRGSSRAGGGRGPAFAQRRPARVRSFRSTTARVCTAQGRFGRPSKRGQEPPAEPVQRKSGGWEEAQEQIRFEARDRQILSGHPGLSVCT